MKLNDATDYQRCFVCGQRNPYGLQLVFRLENNSIVAEFQPREEHQGFPGVIHGGIVAAVLDEALNRTSLLGKNPGWTMTAAWRCVTGVQSLMGSYYAYVPL